MCHKNSVHEAIKNKDDSVVMCMYIDGDYPIIHFINQDKNGHYVDNTLGEWSEKYNYYFIKLINKDEFFDVDKVFDAYRKEIRKQLSFWVRLFSNIEF